MLVTFTRVCFHRTWFGHWGFETSYTFIIVTFTVLANILVEVPGSFSAETRWRDHFWFSSGQFLNLTLILYNVDFHFRGRWILSNVNYTRFWSRQMKVTMLRQIWNFLEIHLQKYLPFFNCHNRVSVESVISCGILISLVVNSKTTSANCEPCLYFNLTKPKTNLDQISYGMAT